MIVNCIQMPTLTGLIVVNPLEQALPAGAKLKWEESFVFILAASCNVGDTRIRLENDSEFKNAQKIFDAERMLTNSDVLNWQLIYHPE